MRDMRARGAAAVVVAAVVGLSGCSGGSGSGDGGKASTAPSASASPSPSPSVVPRDALADYQRATMSGCTDANDCQEFMTRKLAAAVEVREAMEARDPSLYAVPIGYVAEAERQADHFGRGNLGAKGNSYAVSAPLQRMVAWFREHPEG